MTNDQITTLTGAIATIGTALALAFPGLTDALKMGFGAAAVVAGILFSYYTNKHDAPPPPPPPPDPALVKAIAEQLKSMMSSLNAPKAP